MSLLLRNQQHHNLQHIKPWFWSQRFSFPSRQSGHCKQEMNADVYRDFLWGAKSCFLPQMFMRVFLWDAKISFLTADESRLTQINADVHESFWLDRND